MSFFVYCASKQAKYTVYLMDTKQFFLLDKNCLFFFFFFDELMAKNVINTRFYFKKIFIYIDIWTQMC